MASKKVCLALFVSMLMFAFALILPAQQSALLFRDSSQPIDKRVDDLVGRMTLDEKASQMVNHTRAIARLGIPDYDLWSEALHGVANNGIATVFPESIGLGASFDEPLIHEMAQKIAIEGRVKFNIAGRNGTAGSLFQGLTFFSPNINIFRDPRWGRGQETFGEDPFLTAKMGVAFITGLQGNDPDHLTAVATAKHYAVHSGPEPLRHGFDAKASMHDIEDTYLPAFRDAVTTGKVNTIMCVYNAVNGIPGCANNFLLNETLRSEWKFKGFVTGDCNAVDDIWSGHKYAKTPAEAAAFAVKAGTDNDCVVPMGQTKTTEYQKYIDAVKQGLLSEAQLDTALKHMLRTRFALGLFDEDKVKSKSVYPDSLLDSPQHRELAHKLAQESMVLLKNDGILPLPRKTAKIAVVGPLADSSRVLLGNYNGIPSRSTTALDGIKKQFPGAEVVFEPGANFLRSNEMVPASALTTADGAPGLTKEVFTNDAFSGVPVEKRIDAVVNTREENGGYGFTMRQGAEKQAIRWTGNLVPAFSGKHDLGVEGSGNRLYLDGKLIIDTTGPYPPGPSTAVVALERGKKYAIRIECIPGLFSSSKLVWRPIYPDAAQRAANVAQKADVVMAVVGITSDLEGEESGVNIPGFKGGDRTSTDLPQEEQDILEAVQKTGKPLVVVLMSGSALSVNWANKNANAILQAWYPGEEGGAAIAETLAGDNNPAGRLPVTFYESLDQLPAFTNYSMTGRTYRYFKGAPLYPFGYGLSYSNFAYSDIKLSKSSIKAGEALEAETTITNSSSKDGDEVIQAYLVFPKLSGAPKLALRGFTRVHLKAGESRTIKFTFEDRDLSHVNAEGTRLIGTGKYSLAIGGGQPGFNSGVASAAFEIQGEQKLSR